MPKLQNFVAAGVTVGVLSKFSLTIRQSSMASLSLLFVGLAFTPDVISAIYNILIYPFISPYKNLPHSKTPNLILGDLENFRKEEWPGDLQLSWIEANRGAPWIRYNTVFYMERLLISTPAAAHGVLMTHSYSFIKPRFIRSILEVLIGNGVLSAEGDMHKRQRKLLNPAFSFGHIKALIPSFENVVWRLVKNIAAEASDLPKDENGFVVIPIDHRLHESTLDIFFQALFGIDLNPIQNENHPLVKAYQTLFEPEDPVGFLGKLDLILTLTFKAGALPTPRAREVANAKKVVSEYCTQLLDECRKARVKVDKDHPSTDHNLLNILVREGNGLRDQEIIDNMATFIAAGHETTSSATTFAIYWLTKYPVVQAKLREEIRAHLSVYSSECLDSVENPLRYATYEIIESMPYLNNVCREVLRISPPVPITSREAIEDVEIEGQLIRKGSTVFLSAASLGRVSAVWGPDAREFNPDRWNNLPKSAQDPYAFETFLQGPRACIGRKFAELEFKCILIGIVGMFQLEEADPNRDYKVTSYVSSKFADRLNVKLKYAA
ncbi:cytochrome P450 [Lipomyces oligophaga]|uniref:cytochrome P450 n=1 Tax=Lipomyces oligophaga TaxID=45792 RepID=UPI0034CF65D0